MVRVILSTKGFEFTDENTIGRVEAASIPISLFSLSFKRIFSSRRKFSGSENVRRPQPGENNDTDGGDHTIGLMFLF